MPIEFQIIGNAGNIVSQCTIDGFGGFPAVGGAMLTCQIRLRRNDNRDQAAHIRGISIEARVIGNGKPFLGRFLPEYPGVDLDLGKTADWDHDVVLELPLRPEQIDAIEDMRHGGELKLELRVATVLSGLDPLGSAMRWSSPNYYTLTQSEWAQVLAQLGYGKRLLLEIPIEDGALAPGYASAVTHLRNAQGALQRGAYRDVVDLCGNVLEALAKDSLKDHADLPNVRREETNDKARRVQYVRYGLWHLACLARHAGGITEQTTWLREDAIAVLSITATILNWCSKAALEAEKAHR